MYAVWETCGHFSVAASLPNYSATTEAAVEDAARRRGWEGASPAMIAVSADGEWIPTKFVETSELRPLTARQVATYTAVRAGRWKWTNKKPLPSASETAAATEVLG